MVSCRAGRRPASRKRSGGSRPCGWSPGIVASRPGPRWPRPGPGLRGLCTASGKLHSARTWQAVRVPVAAGGREHIDDALDGSGRASGVCRAQHQVAGLRQRLTRPKRFSHPASPHQDDVRTPAQDALEGVRERVGVILTSRWFTSAARWVWRTRWGPQRSCGRGGCGSPRRSARPAWWTCRTRSGRDQNEATGQRGEGRHRRRHPEVLRACGCPPESVGTPCRSSPAAEDTSTR